MESISFLEITSVTASRVGVRIVKMEMCFQIEELLRGSRFVSTVKNIYAKNPPRATVTNGRHAMYKALGDGIGSVMVMMMIILCVSVPLGIWKAIDIILWLIRHVGISWN